MHHLDDEFSRRVECYDAAPGGHGRAWQNFEKGLVQEMGRWADQRAPYTGMADEKMTGMVGGVRVDDEGKCPLRRLSLPVGGHWFTAARPGGMRHIALEEAVARGWSLYSRLRRPRETGAKVLH